MGNKGIDDRAMPIDSVIESLKTILAENIDHFQVDNSKLGNKLYNGLRVLQDGLERMLTECEPIRKVCSSYDLSPDEPGNGIRSSVSMADTAATRVFQLLKQIKAGRGAILFSKKQYVKEVEAWSEAVESLSTILDYLNSVIIPHCEDGDLLPHIETDAKELFSLNNTISQTAFFGRCHAFQYHEAMQTIFKAHSISLCTFSELYYSNGGYLKRTRRSLHAGRKYILNPELRAKRLVDLVQYCSVDFMKAWWALAETELMVKLTTYASHNIQVRELIKVPCVDLNISSVDGELLVIKAPSSCFEPYPISCYLLSAIPHEGMQIGNISKITKACPMSDAIIFHCHGGGFVSQSTTMQEVFLREWAVKTEVPIFSIDYSLSPNAIYPRALEELLTAYVWMLQNFNRLGTTGKRIILTGDSAGGNLVTALTIKCIELGIRIPDAMLLIYTPLILKINPFASRVLNIMDPLLPLAFTFRCLKAYAQLPNKPNCNNLRNNNDSSDTDKQTSSMEESDLTESESDIHEVQNGVKSIVDMNHKDVASEPSPMTDFPLTSDVATENGYNKTHSQTDCESKRANFRRSRKHVTTFLEKYSTETCSDKEGRSIPFLRSLSVDHAAITPDKNPDKAEKGKNAMWDSISSGLSTFAIKKKLEVSKSTPVTASEGRKLNRPCIGKINLGMSLLKGDESISLVDEFTGVEFNNSYYISPYNAPREIKGKFPTTYFMSAEYDVALDDAVMMAKVLRSLGVKTKLKVLEKLPHGFLNLNLVSNSAHDGNIEIINMLKELIHM